MLCSNSQNTCRFLTESMKVLYAKSLDFRETVYFSQYNLLKSIICVFAMKIRREVMLSWSTTELIALLSLTLAHKDAVSGDFHVIATCLTRSALVYFTKWSMNFWKPCNGYRTISSDFYCNNDLKSSVSII